jgi:hypothetical protein
MPSQEFLKWLEQCSTDHWSYNTASSAGPRVGAVGVERAEINAELFKPPKRNAGRRPVAIRRLHSRVADLRSSTLRNQCPTDRI